MHFVRTLVCGLTVCGSLLGMSSASAAQISGEYIESRTCDVYTGPCFANGEVGLAGREAVMAWKVDEGQWNGVSLDGLSAALILKASDTLGTNASFPMKPYPIKSVILVDERADESQQAALVKFVRESAGDLVGSVVSVQAVAITLKNDHLSGKGTLAAGDLARIETRAVAKGDCVCTNESVFYPPLTKVENSQPAYSLKTSFDGEGLNTKWTTLNSRSAFLATFSR